MSATGLSVDFLCNEMPILDVATNVCRGLVHCEDAAWSEKTQADVILSCKRWS